MTEIEIASDLNELPRLLEFVETFTGAEDLSGRLALHLQLALEELVTNVIQHGYGDSNGRIRLALERRGEQVHARVSDTARAYDPFSVAEPDREAPIDERPMGGLGVHLVREFADSYEYERREGKNLVRVSFRV